MPHEREFADALRGVDGVDQVPGGQIEIDAVRNLTAFGVERLIAEFAQDRHQFDAAVEIRARNVHTVVGQHVVFALDALHPLRPHPHQRKVRRTAADVGHQHEPLFRQMRFVVERGRDRLILKVNLPQTD